MTNHAAFMTVASFAGCAALLAACGGGSTTASAPAPGLYVMEDESLVRLDGPPAWERETWGERSDLSSELVILAYDPALATDAALSGDAMVLQRVAFLRNDIDAKSGEATLPVGARWVAAGVSDFYVPLQVVRDAERPGMIRATPVFPLDPGLYALRLTGPDRTINARFGVAWEDVDQVEYQARYCVDRYTDGGRTAFDTCGLVPGATLAADEALTIGDLKPVKRTVSGTEMLVIDGSIENASDRPVRVPDLQASIGGGSNAALQTWTFGAEQAYLLPGDATTFHTELKNPPDSVTNVHVEFAALE